MTNTLVVTKRFYPPWSDGTVSYARGFVESILEASQSRRDLDTAVLSLTDEIWFPKLHRDELRDYLMAKPIDFKWFYSSKKSSEIDVLRLVKKLSRNKDYQLIHIVYTDLDPVVMRLITALPKKHSIIKHIFIYPFHKTFTAQKFVYAYLEKINFLKSINVMFSVSSEVLRKLYGFADAIIIPPAIDMKLYEPMNTKCLNSNTMVEILAKAKIKTRAHNLQKVLSRDIVVLYMGPLTPERFHHKNVLRSISKLKKEFSIDIGLIAVGRGFEESGYLREIERFVKKYDLENRVFFCLKDLSDWEKVYLLNKASIFLYLFQPKLAQMSVVFPPIALLEGMSVGKPVVTGGLPHLDTLIRNLENGILIKDVEDEKAIANGMWNAIVNMERLSSNARTTITREYSIEKVSEAYLTLLDTYGV